MQTESSSNKDVTPGYFAGQSVDGYSVGQSALDNIGFYGATPQTQPTNAAQAAITDGSAGTASATSGIQALTSSYNSGLLANSIATLAAQTNAIRNALVSLGIIKGS